MIGQVVLSSIAVLAGIYFFTRQSFRKRYDLHKLPGPPGLPLLGNLLQIMGQKSLSWHKVRLHLFSLQGREAHDCSH